MLFQFYSYLSNYKIHIFQPFELQTLAVFGKLLFRGVWWGFAILEIEGGYVSFRENVHISLKIDLKKSEVSILKYYQNLDNVFWTPWQFTKDQSYATLCNWVLEDRRISKHFS